MSKKGVVYCLTNHYMPGLVKIGLTEADIQSKKSMERALSKRIIELSSPTGVPGYFELFYAKSTGHLERDEKSLLEAFQDRRVGKKEFVKIDPKSVRAAMKLIAGDEVTVTPIPPPPTFKLSNYFKPGEKLTYKGKSDIQAMYVGGNKIMYDDKEIETLSGIAKKIEGGSVFVTAEKWIYKGKTLQKHKNEMGISSSADIGFAPGDELTYNDKKGARVVIFDIRKNHIYIMYGERYSLSRAAEIIEGKKTVVASEKWMYKNEILREFHWRHWENSIDDNISEEKPEDEI